MNLQKLKEPFPESDIEWRLSQCGDKNGTIWARCLAYISARAVMERLDEVCGPENWQVEYSFIPGSPGISAGVICRLGIRHENGWVWKQDGAEQTDVENFKGGISSALKRAGAAWSIARYLYQLDAGFATIVDSKTDGALYGRTKEGKTFHWIPPSLPAWAVPSPSEVKELAPKVDAMDHFQPQATPLTGNPVLGSKLPPKKVIKQVETKMRIMPKADEKKPSGLQSHFEEDIPF